MTWSRIVCLNLLLVLSITASAFAADWPMWRYGVQRGASTPEGLPGELHVQWTRQLPPARTAWPASQTKLQFDVAPLPVVAGDQIFVPSTVNDSLAAYSTQTGEELWRFTCDGPVRFAPVASGNKVYFVSDDGYLYCLDAATGKLRWRFNGRPVPRRILGNGRLISSWPARGGPVLHDGTIYFATGIWPFMGIFVHAVDAETGREVWTNSGDGTNYTVQPHGAPSFATVAPQGHLVVSGDNLIVPGGRSVPAVYDLHTGRLKYFKYDKANGGHHVSASAAEYYVAGVAYQLASGTRIEGNAPVIVGDDVLLYVDKSRLSARDPAGTFKEVVKKDRRGRKVKTLAVERDELFSLDLADDAFRVHFRAGPRIYAARPGLVAAFDLSGYGDDKTRQPAWTASVDGTVWTMLGADDRLFVVTTAGKLYCFGARAAEPRQHATAAAEPLAGGGASEGFLAQVVADLNLAAGYGLVVGSGRGDLTEQLLALTRLHLIVLDPDEQAVATLRRRLDRAGLYGTRVAVHAGAPASFGLPPYLANLVVVVSSGSAFMERLDGDSLQAVFSALRPYGGTALLPTTPQQHGTIERLARELKLANCETRREGRWTVLTRTGPLPGTADWTHQYANAGQTAVSKDKTVKAPFGVLWFGGPSHDKILPRHGHGPSPQVAGGRLFIEGADLLRAVDVYTGRVLWEKTLPGFGTYYDNTSHWPGAGEIGSNYVSLSDRVYAVYGSAILELDAATGELLREFKLKAQAGNDTPHWGYLAVWHDLLIATSSPVDMATDESAKPAAATGLPPSTEPIIKPHANWFYLAGKDPPGDWTSINASTRGWKTGVAGFGYGDNDDRTTLDMRGKFARVYIRHTFDGQATKGATELGLVINYDDAFIAYLNGTEILRRGIQSGHGAEAPKVAGHEAGGYEYLPIKDWQKLIVPGNNVLAIEGHNSSLTSSDFSLDPYLVYRSSTTDKGQSAAKSQTAAKTKRPSSPQTALSAPSPAPLPLARYASGSRRLIVFNRHTGEQLWSRDAAFNFRHNNIVVGGGKVYCLDSMTEAKRKVLSRRGTKLTGKPRVYALDAYSGAVVWSTDEQVFGTFLSYAEEHDLLLQAGSKYNDRAKDEIGTGMIVYRGRDGHVLWHNPQIQYSGPCLIWRDKIITNGGGGSAIDLRTGKETGWKWKRMYGCNTAIGSEHLLTFRSGAAGFYDLANDGGTGNLGGFRSSCTNNLIVANGVLNAPDYTRTCTCAYQNQTSLALIHMPEAELWTFGAKHTPGRLGVNFGAPGDRRADDGTLWVEYPDVGAPSDDLGVTVEPQQVEPFRFHSSLVQSDGTPWIAGSGLLGVRKVTVPVTQDGEYGVRLFFLEPDGDIGESRVFDVSIQGQPVLTGFNILRQARQPRHAWVKQVTALARDRQIVIELTPRGSEPTLICGVEVVAKQQTRRQVSPVKSEIRISKSETNSKHE